MWQTCDEVICMRYVHLIIVSITIIARQICNEGGYIFIEFLNVKFSHEI